MRGMDRDTLRAAIKLIGLTHTEFADLVGVTPRHVSRWLKGDRAIPKVVAVLVLFVLERPEMLAKLVTISQTIEVKEAA